MDINDGIYTIKNAKAQTSFLTMDKSLARQSTVVFAYSWCGLDTQKWQFKKRAGSTAYNIQNVGTKKWLAIDGDAGNDRRASGKGSGANWFIAKGKGNHVRLYIQNTPYNLDLAGWGDATPGTRVSVWNHDMKYVHQCWILERVQPAPKPSALKTASIQSGGYALVNVHSNKALGLSGKDKKIINTSPFLGGADQQWRIERSGDGYSICSVSSGKYLTFDERISDGANVIANGFPVSWNISNASKSSDIYIRWPTQAVALALVMPLATNGTNLVQLQTFVEANKWQRWELVKLEQCPHVPSPSAIASKPAVQGSQAATVNKKPANNGVQGSTTEAATSTVSVTEDEHSIKTTRTTVTTVTVTVVEPK